MGSGLYQQIFLQIQIAQTHVGDWGKRNANALFINGRLSRGVAALSRLRSSAGNHWWTTGNREGPVRSGRAEREGSCHDKHVGWGEVARDGWEWILQIREPAAWNLHDYRHGQWIRNREARIGASSWA